MDSNTHPYECELVLCCWQIEPDLSKCLVSFNCFVEGYNCKFSYQNKKKTAKYYVTGPEKLSRPTVRRRKKQTPSSRQMLGDEEQSSRLSGSSSSVVQTELLKEDGRLNAARSDRRRSGSWNSGRVCVTWCFTSRLRSVPHWVRRLILIILDIWRLIRFSTILYAYMMFSIKY